MRALVLSSAFFALLASGENPTTASGPPAWQQYLSPRQQERLRAELDDLHRNRDHELHTASSDGPRQALQVSQDFAKKEARIIENFRRIATGTQVAQNVTKVDLGNWTSSLSAKELKELKDELATLQRHAQHELQIAAQDSPRQLEEMRREFSRKTAHIVTEFKSKANEQLAKAKQVTSTIPARAPETQQKPAPAAAAPSLVALSASSPQAGTDDWIKSLPPAQQSEANATIQKLRKKAEHERAVAAADGAKAVDEVRREYARKEADVEEKFQEKAAETSAAQNREQAEHAAVSALGNWTQSLSEQQRSKLGKELVHLREKAAREEKYAREDGQKQLESTQKEYAKKESETVDKFQHEATESSQASRATASQTKQTPAPATGSGGPMVLAAAPNHTNSMGAGDWLDSLPSSVRARANATMQALLRRAKQEKQAAAAEAAKRLEELKRKAAKREAKLINTFKRKEEEALAAEKHEKAERDAVAALGNWTQILTEKQRSKLGKELLRLRERASHAQQRVSSDGKKWVARVQRDTAEREKSIIEEFQHQANENLATLTSAATLRFSATMGASLVAATVLGMTAGALAMRLRRTRSGIEAALLDGHLDV